MEPGTGSSPQRHSLRFGTCPTVLDAGKQKEWRVAHFGWAIGIAGAVTSTSVAALVLAAGTLFEGFLGIASAIPGFVEFFVAFPLGIYAMITYFRIPRRRFADKYRVEYTCKQRLPGFIYGEAIRVRTRRSLLVLTWLYAIALNSVTIFLNGLGPPWGIRAFALMANAGPALVFWGLAYGAYAARDVLLCEAGEKEHSKL